MSIFIEIVAVNGRPPDAARRTEFAESGGGIGRANDNVLRLPDPDRHISRYHARITHRLNRYFILDTGSSTPVILNGIAVGNGREAEIRPGDELRIGQYVLRVNASSGVGPTQIAREALDEDSAAFENGTRAAHRRAGPDSAPPSGETSASAQTAPYPITMGIPTGSPVGMEPAARASSMILAGSSPSVESAVPLGSSFAPASRATDGLGEDSVDLDVGPGAADPRPSPMPPRLRQTEPPPSAGRGDTGFEANAAAESINPRTIVAALKGQISPEYEDMLDELPHPSDAPFGGKDLQSGARASYEEWEGLEALPSPDDRSSADRQEHGDLDMDVGATAERAAPRGEELRGSREISRSAQDLGHDAPNGSDSVLSASQMASRLREAVAHARDRTRLGSRFNRFRPSSLPEFDDSARVGGAGVTALRPEASASARALLKSLYDGAGIAGLTVQSGLTPRQAYAIGALVRVVAFGLRELLADTALEEVLPADAQRSEGPIDNPIAAAASLEDSVGYLLGAQGPPAPAPIAAVQDAFDRLAAVQAVLPNAIRDAFQVAMARFKPQNVLERAGESKGLETFFPGGHKAKLWAVYAATYEERAKEVEDDFRKALRSELVRLLEEMHAEDVRTSPRKAGESD